MHCGNCGAEIPEGNRFCENCGAEISRDEETKNSDQKNAEHKKENKTRLSKKAVIIIIAVVVAVSGIAAAVFFMMDKHEIEAEIINESTAEYMLTNVPADYCFEIKTDAKTGSNKFKVYDIYGKPAAVKVAGSKNKVEIFAPEGGYEKGEIYTLDITGKGSFTDDLYKKAKKLLFIIEQKNVSRIEYKDGVQEIDKEKVISKNGTKLKLKGEYRNGAVIVVDMDGYTADEVYKVVNPEYSEGNTVCEYTEPTTEEVYKDIDIFFSDNIEIKESDIDENALADELKESGILQAFTGCAYADEKKDKEPEIEIKVEKSDKGIGYKCEATIKDPKHKERVLKLTFGLSDKVTAKVNKKLAMVNNTVDVTDKLKFSVESKKAEKIEENINKAINKYVLKEKSDENKTENRKTIVRTVIPIVGTVSFDIDFGIKTILDLSAEFDAEANSDTKFTTGVIYNLKTFKTQKRYAEITGKFDAKITVKGNLNAFAGVYTNAGLSVPALIKIGINGEFGPYIDAYGCFIIDGIPENVKANGYYDVNVGLRFAASGTLKVIAMKEKPLEFGEKKKALWSKQRRLKLLNTNLKNEYYLSNGIVEIGKIYGYYKDIVKDNGTIKEIKNPKVFINDEKVPFKDGKIQKKLKKGKYSLELVWKCEDRKMTCKKKIAISNLNISEKDKIYLNTIISTISGFNGTINEMSTSELLNRASELIDRVYDYHDTENLIPYKSAEIEEDGIISHWDVVKKSDFIYAISNIYGRTISVNDINQGFNDDTVAELSTSGNGVASEDILFYPSNGRGGYYRIVIDGINIDSNNMLKIQYHRNSIDFEQNETEEYRKECTVVKNNNSKYPFTLVSNSPL